MGTRASGSFDNREIRISSAMWQALQFLAQLNHTSASEEIRVAVLMRLQRYGLELRDGEVVFAGTADEQLRRAVQEKDPP